jgi:NADH pyrophosphatase NudC (nudix superfamily)
MAALPAQTFTGSPLCRLSDVAARFRATSRPDAEVSLVVVAGREVVVRAPAGVVGGGGQLELQALLLRQDDPELRLGEGDGEQISLEWVAGEAGLGEGTGPWQGCPARWRRVVRAPLPPRCSRHHTRAKPPHPHPHPRPRPRPRPPEDGAPPRALPLYLLGQDACARWTFALDVSAARDAFLAFLRDACELEVAMKDVRLLLPGLSLDAAAIAGQAVALSQWHQAHGFCHRCGAATLPVEAGTRRRCVGGSPHKLYPRTDPVVIALVESPDGSRALLGRSAKSTPGMYTCLSGFIDQCEGIEEAVRREIMEEARITVSDVAILGTQPWPIGRYGCGRAGRAARGGGGFRGGGEGKAARALLPPRRRLDFPRPPASLGTHNPTPHHAPPPRPRPSPPCRSCELMIGCVARATSYEVLLNASEMEDVQWYDRAELAAAVQAYDSPLPLQEIQRRTWKDLGFFVPPPFAIAHHLMRAWALSPRPASESFFTRQATLPTLLPDAAASGSGGGSANGAAANGAAAAGSSEGAAAAGPGLPGVRAAL